MGSSEGSAVLFSKLDPKDQLETRSNKTSVQGLGDQRGNLARGSTADLAPQLTVIGSAL